jgi:hypothetical protein
VSTNVNVFDAAWTAIRGRLNTYWTANHAAVPIMWENRISLDLAAQTDPFLGCDVVWNDGWQASIEAVPIDRYAGAIHLSIWVKEGGGGLVANQWMGELASLFKHKLFDGVISGAPQPTPARTYEGWRIYVLRIPFKTDDLA